MNDPQVVALIYTVEHRNSVSYENAAPLRFSQSPEFDLTVEDKIARFEFKKFYADEDEARKAIEPFIQQWEFETGIRWGPNNFSLRYKKAEIIDRNPSPPEPGKKGFGASAVLPGLTASAGVLFVNPHYPPPPAGGSVDPDDDYVVKMKRRYDKYRLGRTTLPDAANFCVTILEKKYRGRPSAAMKCGVSKKIFNKIATLASEKGGDDARKAKGADDEFTDQERRFLNRALKAIIIRAAQVAADDSQRHPQITMADLPSL